MRALSLLACLALVACKQRPPPPPPPLPVAALEPVEWRAVSGDAKAEIRQFNLGEGGCRVEGVLSGAVVWASKDCISTSKQLHFASPDAERVVVIDPLPEIANGAWGSAVGVSGYQRGMLVHSNSLGSLIRDAEKLRKTQRYVRWLQGTNDVAGLPPTLTSDGLAVHLETIDGMKFDVRFDQAEGQLLPAAPPDTGPMRTMYEYGDGLFAENFAEVPKKFRLTAKKVQMRTVTPVAPGVTTRPRK